MTEEWEAGKIRVVFIQFGSRRLKNAPSRSSARSSAAEELRQEYDYDDALHRVRPRSLELCNWMPYSVFFTFNGAEEKQIIHFGKSSVLKELEG